MLFLHANAMDIAIATSSYSDNPWKIMKKSWVDSIFILLIHSFEKSNKKGKLRLRELVSCLFLPLLWTLWYLNGHLQYVSMERKLLKWRRQGKRFERLTGIHPADRNLMLNGIWLRMARCGLASSVIVGSYFFAIDHLVSN